MVKFYIYIIIAILISPSLAKQNSIEYFGKVEIEDLFIRNATNETLTKKEIINDAQIDKILMNNEDLELESLEIADIDIATFGAYENFLNKYYDENYYNITSKSMKQLEFIAESAAGARIPIGANAKAAFNSGLDLGLSVSPTQVFNILNFESRLYGNINFTHIKPNDETYANYQITRFTLGTISSITNNLFFKSGFSLLSARGGTIQKSNLGFGSSLNFDIGYKFNLIKQTNVGAYLRAQSMFYGSIDPPIDGGGSVETISIGLIFESPIYLVY